VECNPSKGHSRCPGRATFYTRFGHRFGWLCVAFGVIRGLEKRIAGGNHGISKLADNLKGNSKDPYLSAKFAVDMIERVEGVRFSAFLQRRRLNFLVRR